jgi:hypothetical protein
MCRRRSIALLLSIAVLAGCSSIVHVVDARGAPVEGAEVYAVSLSMNTGPNLTDAEGEASLPDNIQGTKWVEVRKPGFKTAHVDVPAEWPLRVTLQRAGNHPAE